MLSFSFSRISFTKASKYVFLVSTQQQTKRTDVCFSWTSSPTFDEDIQLKDQQTDQIYKIKACQATIDRKLKIVGFCIVEKKDFNNLYLQSQIQQNLIFDNDLQLIQVVEGKDIVVGRCHLQIKINQPKQQLFKSKVTHKQKPQQQKNIKSLQVSAVNSKADSVVNSPFNSARVPYQQFDLPRQPSRLNKNRQQQQNQIDSDFQMKSDGQQQQVENDCSIRFFIHGGSNFYLGSAFSVQVVWGQKYCQTHQIKDKILPQWAQSLILVGNSQKYIIVNILDQKKNILEWTKFSLKNIRKVYPYHLKIIFREQYMGDRPTVYLSFIRQDLPKFTILDKQIKVIVSYQGDNVRNPLQYLTIQSKSQVEIPTFFQLDLSKYSSFEQINKFIESFQIGDYNWNYFIPLETGKKQIIMFKSQLNKELYLFLVSIKNWAQVFSNQKNIKKIQSLSVIQQRPQFQNILKQIYYHQQVHAIGKVTQIYSQTNLLEDTIKDNNTWRTMTKNYVLRNNLLNTSIKNLQILRNQITSKGEQLIKLKKILGQVKSINTTLKQKQKSTLILSDLKLKKQKLSAQSFKITDIEMMLFQKQAQLQFKKKRNQQMTHRMQSLNTMEQDTTQLDQQVIQNAKILLEQQQKIKLMILMRKQSPKQKQIISKLQQIFEKQQLDKEMNQLLRSQQQKLNEIRIKKKQDLKRVYLLLKQKNSQQNNLNSKVEKAQSDLIRLNQVYAKLTGL